MANQNPFAVQGINVVSPKGKALWCKFKEPDRKFDDEGRLETQLVLDPNDPATQAFIERLETLQTQAYNEAVETLGPKGKGVSQRPLYNEDDDGNYVFKFALKSVDRRKAAGKSHTITVVDAGKQKLPDAPLVGNGSTIRVGAFVYPYYMAMNKQIGLTLMWTKMQIIDLVEFGGGADDDFDDEDGYVAPATPSFEEDDF